MVAGQGSFAAIVLKLIAVPALFLCVWAAQARAQDAPQRAEELREVALRQLLPAVPHRFESIAWYAAPGRDWSRVQWEGKLPFDANRSEHNVHQDGRIRVIEEAWQVIDDSGRATLGLQLQSGWNGEQAFTVQSSPLTPTTEPIMHAADEPHRRRNGNSRANAFLGISKPPLASLAQVLNEGLPPDVVYERAGSQEYLQFEFAGGRCRMRFDDDRLLGWTATWTVGDQLQGKTLPYTEGYVDGTPVVLEGWEEKVEFSDFRMTALGISLPHELTAIDQLDYGSNQMLTLRIHARRRNIEPAPELSREDFSPVDVPVGTLVDAFPDSGGGIRIWDGTRAVIDDGTQLERRIDATVARQLAANPAGHGGGRRRAAPLWAQWYLYVLGGAVLLGAGVALALRARGRSAGKLVG